MSTEPKYTHSQHSNQYSTDHHLKTLTGKVKLIWPTDKMSGPYVPDIEGTPHQLWGYILTNPPWPWNLLVYEDGTVRHEPGLSQNDINAADYVLWGGHSYVLDEGSWMHETLVANGYTFVEETP